MSVRRRRKSRFRRPHGSNSANRLPQADELEFEHIAVEAGGVERRFMPEIEMDQSDRARFAVGSTVSRPGSFSLYCERGMMAVGPIVLRDVLRVIEHHDPPWTVAAHRRPVPVLMPLTAARRLVARLIIMHMPVRMHIIVRSKNACQRAFHDRRVEELPDVRHARQYIVAGIAFILQRVVDLAHDALVKFFRQFILQNQVSIDDKVGHLLVGEQIEFVVHGMQPLRLR